MGFFSVLSSVYGFCTIESKIAYKYTEKFIENAFIFTNLKSIVTIAEASSKRSLLEQGTEFIVDRSEDLQVGGIGEVEVVVHDVVRDGLVVLDDVVVDLHHVDVAGDLIGVGFVAKLVDQEGIDVVVPLPVRIGILSSGQQRLQNPAETRNNSVTDSPAGL
jgi:hypothetical protein